MDFDEKDYLPSYQGCPNLLKSTLAEAIELKRKKDLDSMVKGACLFYVLGMNFYKLSRWMCSDYQPLYSFAGDCFQSAAGLFSKVNELKRLALSCYGRAGHCYLAAVKPNFTTYCFFMAYELSLILKDENLIEFYSIQSWSSVADNQLFSDAFSKNIPDNHLLFDRYLLTLNGHDFEWLVWFILQKQEFKVKVSKLTRDGGVDLIGTYNEGDPLKRLEIIAQCKNYKKANKKVPISVIREFIGVYVNQNKLAHKMFIFSSTDFTSDAKKLVQTSKYPIVLVNRQEIYRMLKITFEDLYQNVFPEDLDNKKEELPLLLKCGVHEEPLLQLFNLQEARSAFGTFLSPELLEGSGI